MTGMERVVAEMKSKKYVLDGNNTYEVGESMTLWDLIE